MLLSLQFTWLLLVLLVLQAQMHRVTNETIYDYVPPVAYSPTERRTIKKYERKTKSIKLLLWPYRWHTQRRSCQLFI